VTIEERAEVMTDTILHIIGQPGNWDRVAQYIETELANLVRQVQAAPQPEDLPGAGVPGRLLDIRIPSLPDEQYRQADEPTCEHGMQTSPPASTVCLHPPRAG
jgi:hypothetical protein